MISGHGDMETAINDATWCIWLYIKTSDLNRLLNTVRNALDKKQLVVENKILRKKSARTTRWLGIAKL
jgi:DNA-binding NtrC family response regulator